MSDRTFQQSIKTINKVYHDYEKKVNELKSKQLAIISNFIKKLEKKKVEDVRKELKQ